MSRPRCHEWPHWAGTGGNSFSCLEMTVHSAIYERAHPRSRCRLWWARTHHHAIEGLWRRHRSDADRQEQLLLFRLLEARCDVWARDAQRGATAVSAIREARRAASPGNGLVD